jgi:hypothetical protein
MSGKQMEGDNRERRRNAREARDSGKAPSEEKVTMGSSKQRHHLPQSEDHEVRKETPSQGKR